MANITQGSRVIARDPSRANTVSGKDKHCGPSKELGAALVAKVMAGAERGQPNDDQQNRDRFGVKFRIGENQAKQIDHDAAPK